jgi:hypothetical protein
MTIPNPMRSMKTVRKRTRSDARRMFREDSRSQIADSRSAVVTFLKTLK